MSDNKIELSGIFSEGYGFVPKKLMKAKDISNTTKVVLCYLLSYTGAGVSCFPQIKDIASDLGLTTRTIINCINSAIENKYLKKYQENRGGKIGKKNTYELLFMYDFNLNKHVKIKSRADVACENKEVACEKNDNQHVNEGQSNNNSIKSNNNNNNAEVFNFLDKLFKDNNPTYYRNGKESANLKHLATRFKTTERITEVFDIYKKQISTKDNFWSSQPLTPSAMYSNIDRALKINSKPGDPLL